MKKILGLIYILASNVILAQNWEWVKLMQPNDTRSYMGIKFSVKNEKVYGGGNFNQSINLGKGHTITGGWDGFLAEFDTAGLCQWHQKISVTTQGCGCNAQGNRTSATVSGFDSQGI